MGQTLRPPPERRMLRAMRHDDSGRTTGAPAIRWWRVGDRGPRVLLIMGFGMRGDVWRPQIEGLSDDHRVAYFDNRGIGESERGPKRRWTMADMAADALGVMDTLGWDDAHVVGVSMGGMIAQELALRAERRLRSLSLIATHEGGPLRHKLPTVEGLREFVRANTSRGPARVEALQRLLYPEHFLREVDPRALGERMNAQMGRPAGRETFLGQLHAVARHHTGPRLGQLRVPTLIVKPALDVLIRPESADRLRRRIPHARLLTLPDAGHGAIFQRAREVNDALRRHVQDAEMVALASGGSDVHA